MAGRRQRINKALLEYKTKIESGLNSEVVFIQIILEYPFAKDTLEALYDKYDNNIDDVLKAIELRLDKIDNIKRKQINKGLVNSDIIISLDLGLSTSKIIILDHKNNIKYSKILDNNDYQINNIENTLNIIIKQEKIDAKNIKIIYATGISSKELDKKILGLEVTFKDELKSIGFGGCRLANVKKCLVISIGTGTAFLMVKTNRVNHVGGVGLGGGTIVGIANKVIDTTHFPTIVERSLKGRDNKSDITIDVTYTASDKMNKLSYITASNLGNLNDDVNNDDFIYGSIKMIIQNICVCAAILAKSYKLDDIVITGSVTNIPYVQEIADEVGILYNTNFIVPDNAAYATAFGAVFD